MIDKLQGFYGFTRMPFGRDLAPGMLHRHAAHGEAVARITWCITEHRIGVITGEVGAGKTVAIRAAIAALDATRHTTIYLPNPTVGVRGMLHHIVACLGQVPAFYTATLAPQAADAAFRLKDMNEAAGPIDTQRGPVFMAMVERKDPYVPELKEVETRVREDLIRSRGTELSRKRGAEIAATLSGAKDFKAAAKALGFEAKETALISRGAPIPDVGVSADIDKLAFSLPVGGVSQPISTSDGTAIVKVTERDEATPEELKKDRETFRAELLNERRERFFSAYMNKARERTPIEVNNDVIRRTLNARGL